MYPQDPMGSYATEFRDWYTSASLAYL